MPIHMDTRNEVAILAMDNSPGNAFTSDMIQQFNATLDRIEADDKIRGVVVTGADGQFFSSGMDLQYVMKLEVKAIKIFFKTLFTFFHRTFVFPKPMVGAINGHVVASALAFSMCMDYRVMQKEKAVCTFPEIDVSITPPSGCLAMVKYVIGERMTDLAFLSGRKFDELRLWPQAWWTNWPKADQSSTGPWKSRRNWALKNRACLPNIKNASAVKPQTACWPKTCDISTKRWT